MNPTWLGLDLTPLADESIFCVLARLQWMNVLSLPDLRRYFAGSKNGAAAFYGHEESRLRWLVDAATGWSTYSAASAFSELPPSVMTAWFAPNLTVCAECARGFYHSHWHQLRALQCCPIHGCPLLRQCPTCGHPLDAYRFSAQLLERPFCCSACGAAFAGQAATWQAITGFRERHIELRRQWQPWRRWAQTLRVRLRWCEKYAKTLDEGRLSTWWSVSGLVQALTCQFHESPPGCDWDKPDISWLVWPMDDYAAHTEFNPYPTLTQWRWSRNPYAEVISELRAWINATCTLPTQCPNPDLFDAHGQLIRGSWPSAALAYMVMRRTWEPTEVWSPAAPAPDDAELRLSLSKRLELPRKMLLWHTALTVRALFLAVFAALYWRIERGDSLDIVSCCIDDAAAAFLFSRATMPPFGMLCFPTVPGMPLKAFSPSSLRLWDAQELLQHVATRSRRARKPFPWNRSARETALRPSWAERG